MADLAQPCISRCVKRSSIIFWLAVLGAIFVLVCFILMVIWLITLGFSSDEQGFGITILVLSGLALVFCAVGAYGTYGVFKCPPPPPLCVGARRA